MPNRLRSAVVVSLAAFALSDPGIARADVSVPPIPVVDFFAFGPMLGGVFAVAALVASVCTFVLLKKRGVRPIFAGLVGLAVFLAVDLCAYSVGRESANQARQDRDLERQLEEDMRRVNGKLQSASASGSAALSAPASSAPSSSAPEAAAPSSASSTSAAPVDASPGASAMPPGSGSR